jgi:hypothetical protein
MHARPQLLCRHATGKKKISVLLIDWGVRESFHCLEHFNRQTVPRDEYELIWLEFYDHKPDVLRRLAAGGGPRPCLDKWIVLGYPNDFIFHKHRLYNVGFLAAAGEVCVICDSDAIFRPTFIESLLRAFDETPDAVVHLDEVRNTDPQYYPYREISMEELRGPGCANWSPNTNTTTGLAPLPDKLHRANYGACMAARRDLLLGAGGADEHLDYLGFICGPYELTFRLANQGRQERWLLDEYLYHLWHPNTTGINTDYQGPHDGRYMSLRALHARASGRVEPFQENPWVRRHNRGKVCDLERLLGDVADRPEPGWVVGTQPAGPPDVVYWADREQRGFNLFVYRDVWFALPVAEGLFDPQRARRGGYRRLLRGENEEHIRALVAQAVEIPPGFRGLVRKVFSQPLRRLPGRLWRKLRRDLFAPEPV